MRYMDHAATTPVRQEVMEAMLPFLQGLYGNPSSVYAAGREAKKAMEEAREQIALAIGGLPQEVFFTAGGTEADNHAVKGAAFRNRSHGDHIITTKIEHHAVLHPAKWLEGQGFRVTYLDVDDQGRVDLEQLETALEPKTILVSIMYVNNEIGTVQDLARAVSLVKGSSRALFHTDAVQALGKVPLGLEALGVDLASFSAHKVGGPKGTGCIYVRRKTGLEPLLHGGGQERDLRSGTPNVAGIAGFGLAAQMVTDELETETERLSALRDRLESELVSRIGGVYVNGGESTRVANILNVCIDGIEGESLLLMLDGAEIAASSGSACTSGSLDPSHVLLAMGVSRRLAAGSLRISFGHGSSEEDVDHLLSVLPGIVERLRSIS